MNKVNIENLKNTGGKSLTTYKIIIGNQSPNILSLQEEVEPIKRSESITGQTDGRNAE